MVARAVSAFGRIDCAFNNAGIAGRAIGPAGQRTHELSQQAFDRMLAVNLTGVFLCLKHEVTQMLAQGGGGAIVNTASIAGLIGLATSAHYVAAKHGILGFTKSTALEGAQFGIRVNAICPGYVRTPLVEGQIADTAKARGISEEAVVKDVLLAAQPTKEFVKVSDVAALAVFLTTDAANQINGAALSIDGGWVAQ